MQCNWPQRLLLMSGISLSSTCKMCTRSAQETSCSLSRNFEARLSVLISGYACGGPLLRPCPWGAPVPLPHPSRCFAGVWASPNLHVEVGEQLFEPVLDDEKL